MNKRTIIAAACLCAALWGCAGDTGTETEGVLIRAEEPEEVPSEVGETQYTDSRLTVYVCGAVENPGVYTFPAGARVYEAVDAAGGLREDAAQTALNLAELLTDAQMINIPTVDEYDAELEAAAEETSALVNINRAGLSELMELPGIGASKAQAVIDYREANGGFASPEEIMNIPGIKSGVYERIKELITV